MNIRQTVKQAIINSKEYTDFLNSLADELNSKCQKANSEATIAAFLESTLKECFSFLGENFIPIKELSLKGILLGKVCNKRLDSKYQNIIFEYKRNIQTDFDKYTSQLFEYIKLTAKKENQDIERYVGILIDGCKCVFLNINNNSEQISNEYKITGNTLKRILNTLLSLDKKNLSSQNLLLDFSIQSNNQITKNLIKALYKLLRKPNERTYMLNSEWERIFSLGTANDNNMQLIQERKKALANCFDIEIESFDETKGLFALQTAYTIIIKLIAYNVISNIYLENSVFLMKNLLRLDNESLRCTLEDIENGDIFRQLGIKNLLEGDFFSWYVYKNTWNKEIFDAIKNCIEVLCDYDANRNIFSKNNMHDLFIDLYQEIMPTQVRRSLGEYYTPFWLAEHVLNNTPKTPDWKGLDPCAGSGTFVLCMIKHILEEQKLPINNKELLTNILSRVKAIDINPLAILTCRLNYFLAISHYIDANEYFEIEIPVYLGDSAFVPEIKKINNIDFISYSITTQKGVLHFKLPVSLITNKVNITSKIIDLENAIQNLDQNLAEEILWNLLPQKEKNDYVLNEIRELIANLIYLENKNWDRIWVRIIVNFLKIATFDKFSIIVGNPPWIDWKTLPDGYRKTLKEICIDRDLFSGDNFTGGINLNICALICNVVSNNWLKENGYLSFLMPKSMVFQQSYGGFRKLTQKNGSKLNFVKFIDWSDAGHPFKPVTEKFMTYILKKTNENCSKIIPTIKYKKTNGEIISPQDSLDTILKSLEQSTLFAIQNTNNMNNFLFHHDPHFLNQISKIEGKCIYKGRVGLGLYPKELMLFKYQKNIRNLISVENYQGNATEKKFAKKMFLFEPTFIHPVIEGPNIDKFGIKDVEYYAPFPYNETNTKVPLEENLLQKLSPNLHKYLKNNIHNLKKTEYNSKVQGNKGAFYSLTRVGKYTFAKYRVLFRNNTKWVATVIEDAQTHWNEKKSYLLLDHACSISQKQNGEFITKKEAHYICAILNSHLINEFILNSSDKRSFKTDIPIKIPPFDSKKVLHNKLADLSIKAHHFYKEKKCTRDIENKINDLVFELYNNLNSTPSAQ